MVGALPTSPVLLQTIAHRMRRETAALRNFGASMSELGQSRRIDMLPALAACPLHLQ
jgi:hypothetical protein